MADVFREYPALSKIEPITLEEMDSVKLMNRMDTKYVTTEAGLDRLLEIAADKGYRACVIGGEKITPYDSMYYDTDDLEMFRIHRAGKSVRQKIRVRTYTLTGDIYLEIKRKNNKGRTKKKRMPLPCTDLGASTSAAEFIAGESMYTLDKISKACSTGFRRITLVNREKTERITLDTGLHFSNARTGESASLPGLVIIELKQDGRIASTMKDILLSLRIHPFKVSKYCIGTLLTSPALKPGRFKIKIRHIQKTLNKTNRYEKNDLAAHRNCDDADHLNHSLRPGFGPARHSG
jgi:VTC domain.